MVPAGDKDLLKGCEGGWKKKPSEKLPGKASQSQNCICLLELNDALTPGL